MAGVVEFIRDIKITVKVDTNKRTLTDQFETREEFEDWWRDHVEGLGE